MLYLEKKVERIKYCLVPEARISVSLSGKALIKPSTHLNCQSEPSGWGFLQSFHLPIKSESTRSISFVTFTCLYLWTLSSSPCYINPQSVRGLLRLHIKAVFQGREPSDQPSIETEEKVDLKSVFVKISAKLVHISSDFLVVSVNLIYAVVLATNPPAHASAPPY